MASVGFSHVLIGFTAVRSENRPTALAPCCNLFHFHKVPIYFRRAIQFVETILALKRAIKSLRSVIKITVTASIPRRTYDYHYAVFSSSTANTGP